MGSDSWYKVDNVAKVFLATLTKRDPKTLRVSCTLKEDIDPDLLQKALLSAIQDRPQFQMRIRRGLFWHYMENTDILPEVSEESDRVCPLLYIPARTMLHYRVTYFGKRINLDMFHALSDGTGALEFLDIIVLFEIICKISVFHCKEAQESRFTCSLTAYKAEHKFKLTSGIKYSGYSS